MRGKIVLLGTSSAVPTKERNNSAVYLKYLGEAFLFDCGEGTQRQLIKGDLNMYRINHIFISHLHSDHVLGLPGLIQTVDFLGSKEKLFVHSVEGIKEKGNCLLKGSIYQPEMETVFIEYKNSNEPFTVIDTDKYCVKAISLNHVVDCLGFSFEEKPKIVFNKEKIKELDLKDEDFIDLKNKGYIEKGGKRISIGEITTEKKGFKFTYIPDTYKTENIVKLARGSDVLVIECTYLDEEEKAREYKHLTLEYILDIYPELECKQIVLTHFSKRYKNLEEHKRRISKRGYKNIILGKDFLTLEF